MQFGRTRRSNTVQGSGCKNVRQVFKAKTILNRLDMENLLKERLVVMGYLHTQIRNQMWEVATSNMIPEFPRLTWSQLEDVTLGV